MTNVGFLSALAIAVGISFGLNGASKDAHAVEVATLSDADSRQALQRIAPYCQPNVPVEKAKYTEPTNMADKFVPVVLYHRITDADEPSHEVTRPKLFREHMDWLKKAGYETMSVAQLTDYMSGKLSQDQIPEKPIVITFDDGWKDNIDASEYLKKMGFGATWYILSGFFKNEMYMDEKEVRALGQTPKFEIGSHTHSHFVEWESKLGQLDLCTMAKEMAASKTILERVVGKPIRSIAWPYGHNTHEAVYVAGKLGYTSTGMVNPDSKNRPGNSPLFTYRMNIDGNCKLEDFQKMVTTGDLVECSVPAHREGK